MRNFLHRLISSGLHPDLDEGMKVAIMVANVDVLLTILTLFFYSVSAITSPWSPLTIIHPLGLSLAIAGYFLIRFRHYDLGRYLIHFNGLVMIFCPADIYERGSGFEFYYIISVLIPFVTFALSEQWKGMILSAIAAITLIIQEILGPGVFFETVPFPPGMKSEAIIIVMIYLTAIFAIGRWQLARSQKFLDVKQRELIHQSGLIALGEMSGGIAHEINNPLQSIALQTEYLRRELRKPEGPGPRAIEIVNALESTGMRIAKMVKGLKDLSRDVALDSPEIFEVGKVIDDVLTISQEKLSLRGISLSVSGEVSVLIKGSSVQISQVLMNLLNNSIDALDKSDEKWIRVEVSRSEKNVLMSITDSGNPISDEIAGKMLRPFFTTKEPSKGTGLGLSISSSIVARHGGRLYYDSKSKNTRFVIELPLAGSV